MKAILLLVLLLPGCSLYSDIKGIAADVKRVSEAVKVAYAEADKNQDGKVSGTEWWEFALAFLGALGVAGGGAKAMSLSKDRADHKARTAALEASVGRPS